MLKKEQKDRISKIIEEQNPVVIISHINPDGDSVGSTIGLALFLKKMGIPVSVLIPNEIPDFLQWMPGYDLVKIFMKQKKTCQKILKEAKTVFFLDFNEPGRMADLEQEALNNDAYKILIDHHQNPKNFADILISEPWRGSVGEMVYLLIQEMGMTELLDKNIATCLYVAIITDTGNFRHKSSYAEIFSISGSLIDIGIDKDAIYSAVYDSYSINRMKLLGYCMSERMKIMETCNTAYIGISQEELDRYNYQIGDTEGFVNIPFSIKGIKVSALFIEKKERIKVSLRSKGSFSVDKFAAKYYHGGGHINAAGGDSFLSLEETLKQFEEYIGIHANEISAE